MLFTTGTNNLYIIVVEQAEYFKIQVKTGAENAFILSIYQAAFKKVNIDIYNRKALGIEAANGFKGKTGLAFKQALH